MATVTPRRNNDGQQAKPEPKLQKVEQAFHKSLSKAKEEDEAKEFQSNSKDRKLNIGGLAMLLWGLVAFVFHRRHRKTRAEAIVRAVFDLADKYPQYFDEELKKQCRAFVKKNFKPWKVQKTICLLYTSPSPRDGLLSRMPSSA